uniref:kelch-like protein 3 n=1 Tax=Styela clava TaxID=7725 RepID=UPI00193AAA94|nr:kelch-like protein 3 [Styela clava]
MHGIDSDALEKCIEFMYTGEPRVTQENVQAIIHASHYIQQHDLLGVCYQFLQTNLSAQTCLTSMNLAKTYGNELVRNQALTYFKENLATVISTPQFRFVTLVDLTEVLQGIIVTHNVKWKAIVTWMRENTDVDNEDLPNLRKSAKVFDFPFKFSLFKVWPERFVQENLKAQNMLLRSFFGNTENFNSNLNAENCYILRNLAKSKQISEEKVFTEIIDQFLMKNFNDVATREEFLDLSQDDVARFISSPITAASEKDKCCAILKWAKHDEKARKKTFPKLFKLIDLKHIPRGLICEVLQLEPLVMESAICKDLLLNYFINQDDASNEFRLPSYPCILTLNGETGKIEAHGLQTNVSTTLCRVRQYSNLKCFGNDIFVSFKGLLYLLRSDGNWENVIEEMPTKNQLNVHRNFTKFRNQIYIHGTGFYDISAKTWSTVAPTKYHFGRFYNVIADERRVYITGQSSSGGDRVCLLIYEPDNYKWDHFTESDVGISDGNYPIVALHGVVYILGCGSYRKGVVRFDPRYRRSERIADMSRFRFGLTACVVEGKLYAVGGDLGPQNNTQAKPPADTIELYDERKNSWEVVRSITPSTKGYQTSAYHPM